MALTKRDLLEVGKVFDQKLNLDGLKKLIRAEINRTVDQRLDWDAFKKFIRLEIDGALEEKLKEKLKYLPTKDEFYKQMDAIMKKLEAIRQELTLTPSHADLATLEERIEPLERLYPGGKHGTFASV